MPNHVPNSRNPRPFIQQDRLRPPLDDRGISGHRFGLGSRVQLDHALHPLLCSRGLANPLRTVESERWDLIEQLIQLTIDNATHIVHGYDATSTEP